MKAANSFMGIFCWRGRPLTIKIEGISRFQVPFSEQARWKSLGSHSFYQVVHAGHGGKKHPFWPVLLVTFASRRAILFSWRFNNNNNNIIIFICTARIQRKVFKRVFLCMDWPWENDWNFLRSRMPVTCSVRWNYFKFSYRLVSCKAITNTQITLHTPHGCGVAFSRHPSARPLTVRRRGFVCPLSNEN